MTFGLTNVPVVFMDLMNKVFKSFLDQFVIVCIDDILIYSKSGKKYREHLRRVLQVQREKKLYTKLNKCKFWLDSITFLGHVIYKVKVSINLKKVETIVKLSRHITITKIHRFLGLVIL